MEVEQIYYSKAMLVGNILSGTEKVKELITMSTLLWVIIILLILGGGGYGFFGRRR